MTACQQKGTKDVLEYDEWFKTVKLEHSGLTDRGHEDVGQSYLGPLWATFVAGLKPELAKMLMVIKPDWEQMGTIYGELVEQCDRLDRYANE
eukprot:g47747.t1